MTKLLSRMMATLLTVCLFTNGSLGIPNATPQSLKQPIRVAQELFFAHQAIPPADTTFTFPSLSRGAVLTHQLLQKLSPITHWSDRRAYRQLFLQQGLSVEEIDYLESYVWDYVKRNGSFTERNAVNLLIALSSPARLSFPLRPLWSSRYGDDEPWWNQIATPFVRRHHDLLNQMGPIALKLFEPKLLRSAYEEGLRHFFVEHLSGAKDLTEAEAGFLDGLALDRSLVEQGVTLTALQDNSSGRLFGDGSFVYKATFTRQGHEVSVYVKSFAKARELREHVKGHMHPEKNEAFFNTLADAFGFPSTISMSFKTEEEPDSNFVTFFQEKRANSAQALIHFSDGRPVVRSSLIHEGSTYSAESVVKSLGRWAALTALIGKGDATLFHNTDRPFRSNFLFDARHREDPVVALDHEFLFNDPDFKLREIRQGIMTEIYMVRMRPGREGAIDPEWLQWFEDAYVAEWKILQAQGQAVLETAEHIYGAGSIEVSYLKTSLARNGQDIYSEEKEAFFENYNHPPMSASKLDQEEELSHIQNACYFVLGSWASDIGTFVQGFGQAWLLTELTHGPDTGRWLSWDSGALALGIVMGLPFTSVIAERTGQRLYIAMTAAQFSLPAALAFLAHMHMANPSILVILSWVSGVFQSLGASQFNRLSKAVREELPLKYRAPLDTIGQLKINIARMIGPLIGSLLFNIVGIVGCYLINGFSFLIYAGALMRMNFHIKPQENIPWLQTVKEGIRYWKEHRVLVYLYTLSFAAALFGMPFQALLAAFYKTAGSFGYSQGLYFLGAVAANVLGMRLAKSVGTGIIDKRPWIAPVGFGISILFFLYSTYLPVKLAALILAGGTYAWMRMVASNYTNHQVGESHISRVQAIFYIFQHGGQTIGTFFSGELVKRAIGIPGTVTMAAVGLIVSGLGIGVAGHRYFSAAGSA